MIEKDNLDLLSTFNSSREILKIKSAKKNKKLLNNKRKRENEEELIEIKNKQIKQENNNGINSFKFQDFPKNNLIVIFSYLDLDDIIKLKNIGCRNVRNYIEEIIETKKSKGYFNLKLISSIKTNAFIFDNDSISCKKYFYLNILNNYNISNKFKIKYIIYHKSSKKNYYLIKTCFNYYFCSCAVDKEITKENWKDDILFKIKELRHFDKFQFIDESKVVFFSLNIFLLYDLLNAQYKYHIFYLNFICDFVLYKKKLSLLIVPHVSFNYVSFYSINKSLPIKVKKEKYKMEINHTNKACENGQIIDLLNNLICYFCSCNKSIKIFDCKKMKIINDIKLDYDIDNIDVNKKYLIVHSNNNNIMNFFDNVNFQYIFNFSLDNNGIKYMSMIEPSFDNIFLMIKKNNKMCLIYLENNYYSFVPLNNDYNLNDIENNQFISNSLFKKEIIDYEIIFKLNTKLIYSKDYSTINEYVINDFVMDI